MFKKDTRKSRDLFDLPEKVGSEEELSLLLPEGYFIQEGQGYMDVFTDTGTCPVVIYVRQ